MKGKAILLGMLIFGIITLLSIQAVSARPEIKYEAAFQDESDPTIILNNLESLYRKLAERALMPGWLHATYTINNNTDESDNGKLDNGQIIPLNYILDEWYLLDSDRHVSQAVTFMLSMDKEVLQTSIFEDGRWKNLTLGEEFTPAPFTPDLYFDFLDNARNFRKIDDAALKQSVVNFNGKDVLQFSIIERDNPPIKLESLNQAVTGGEVRALIDMQTGEIYRIETILETTDGAKRTTLQITMLALEHGKAPDLSALDLLNNQGD